MPRLEWDTQRFKSPLAGHQNVQTCLRDVGVWAFHAFVIAVSQHDYCNRNKRELQQFFLFNKTFVKCHIAEPSLMLTYKLQQKQKLNVQSMWCSKPQLIMPLSNQIKSKRCLENIKQKPLLYRKKNQRTKNFKCRSIPLLLSFSKRLYMLCSKMRKEKKNHFTSKERENEEGQFRSHHHMELPLLAKASAASSVEG